MKTTKQKKSVNFKYHCQLKTILWHQKFTLQNKLLAMPLLTQQVQAINLLIFKEQSLNVFLRGLSIF